MSHPIPKSPAHIPNAITLAAMKEVESGALRNEPALDLSSIEAMEKSLNISH
ncbi:MAG: hypothetical protein K2M93_09150 [Muribaculaceae bacterium]|nr:hypothetical protein [Muribaculaceae bacterium]